MTQNKKGLAEFSDRIQVHRSLCELLEGKACQIRKEIQNELEMTKMT